jgi:hypothetical protein
MTASALWIGYIVTWSPFEKPFNNRLEVLNEFFYYVLLDLSISFTAITAD